MCKYCEFEKIEPMESHGSKLIGSINEGHIGVFVTLNRHAETNGESLNYIEIEEAVKLDGDDYTAITNKYIDIKYCPFCGEKL